MTAPLFRLSLSTLYFLFSCLVVSAQIRFSTKHFTIQISDKGQIISLLNRSGGTEYLSKDTTAALLSVKSGGLTEQPARAGWNKKSGMLTLEYPQTGVRAELAVAEKNTHLVFEIRRAEPAERIEAVVWGPYPTTISKTIGEIVGVVRDGHFAIGIQALNPETIGGLFLNNEGMVDGRGSAAWTARWGSTLQAFAINRAKPREADVWWGSFKRKPVTPLPGKTVAGSKIALFGCPEAEAQATLGAIELAEGLPHPTLKGVWAKASPLAGQSYLISSFSETEVDEMIAATKRAGLISLYHEGPFKSWGHYEFNPEFFPEGKESVKRCVEKAHAAGLYFGVHTLTNFINTNDPYVSPVPDPRLVRTGSSMLSQSISIADTELPVVSPEYFRPEQNNTLHTVQIGNELIRYRAVSDTAPWRLLDCMRGAFGTAPAAHAAGAVVGKLMDHPYQIFFPELDLQHEIARNLAQLFNETGVDHLDFDGHEGGLACGQGDYGIEMFSKVFHDNIRHEYLNGTSNSKHFYWHINTYCNWGEPWYGGFRESMQEYRIQNQSLFDRNFMPHMLGWYLMTATTSLAEMEWMLARAAGYDAGFAMVLRPDALRRNPIAGTLLDAIREWEAARNAGAFTTTQQERLKDPRQEFHLEKSGENTWKLYSVQNTGPFTHRHKTLQPGEPAGSVYTFENPEQAQPLQFRMEVTGPEGSVTEPVLSINNYYDLMLPLTLAAGESVVCDGKGLLRIYDAEGRQRNTYSIAGNPPSLSSGKNAISINASFTGTTKPEITFWVKWRDQGAEVKKNP
jgi:hypothetical protein